MDRDAFLKQIQILTLKIAKRKRGIYVSSQTMIFFFSMRNSFTYGVTFPHLYTPQTLSAKDTPVFALATFERGAHEAL